ncbi:PIN domain-containing protein [Patescibacteria group bacterium]|nr:PIN domain-containing protein [Patescibacteria group bacterium]MBU4017342.1 PIN domain-containing protein [Patescibacteria group bacterium]MBU4098678.1 PIN domain-containing protein [Patescibacteria group bacterium]
MKIFIDTSAFIALLVENELDHLKVAKKYFDYRQQRSILFTSYFILDELFTRLLYYKNINIKKYIQVLQTAIAANELTVMQVDEALFEKSITVFMKFSEHNISFTDATTYILYKEYFLDEIFTLDSDFKKMRIKTSF